MVSGGWNWGARRKEGPKVWRS